MRYPRFELVGCWGVFIAARGLLPETAGAQQDVLAGPRQTYVRIETAQSTVRAGDPIKVRLTLTNRSSRELMLPSAAPNFFADLHVYDEAGNEVKPVAHGRFPQF